MRLFYFFPTFVVLFRIWTEFEAYDQRHHVLGKLSNRFSFVPLLILYPPLIHLKPPGVRKSNLAEYMYMAYLANWQWHFLMWFGQRFRPNKLMVNALDGVFNHPTATTIPEVKNYFKVALTIDEIYDQYCLPLANRTHSNFFWI